MKISRKEEEEVEIDIDDIQKESINEVDEDKMKKIKEEDLNKDFKEANIEEKEKQGIDNINNKEIKNNNINIKDYEVIQKNDDSDINLIRYSNSDVELFADFIRKESNDDSNENMNEFLRSNKNRFRYINPLRIKSQTYGKKPMDKIKSKTMAIKELVTNLKTQYILFNVKDFIRQYQIKSNPYISRNLYRSIRILRNTCLYIYGIIMIFERPWFCYKDTTIPLPKRIFNFIENCDKKVEFLNIPFIYNDLLRVIEIIQTFIIIVTQIMKYKDEYNLRKTNIGANKYYNIIQII